ncbi:MAG: hypothetical protein Q9198_006664, partial [Flavoplaca austrocitrina]
MPTPASNVELLQRASSMMQAARRQANYQREVEDLDELIQDAEASVHFAKTNQDDKVQVKDDAACHQCHQKFSATPEMASMAVPCCMIFVHVDCAVIQWDSPVKTWICGKCGSSHTAAHLKGEWHKAANDMRVNLVRQGLIDKMRYPDFYKHKDHKYNWNDRNTWPYCWVHDFQG